MNDDHPATAYSPAQFDLNYPPGAEHHYWNLARNTLVAREVRRLGPADPLILDVGCGRGLVVDSLRAHGVACWGVELAAIAPLESVRSYVRSGLSAEALPEDERRRFTALLLLDVLEHLPDPAAFLGSLAAAFPNVRHMLVTVPARQEVWSNYDEFYGHFRRYDVPMLTELGSRLHWKVERASYFFHALYAPARLMRACGVRRNVQFGAPTGLARLPHRLLAAAFVAEYALLPRRLPGTSLIGRLARP